MKDGRQSGKTSRGLPANRLLVVLVLAIVVAATFHLRSDRGDVTAMEAGPVRDVSLPHMIDLGSDKCIPCKTMAPILEKLRVDFAGVFEITFIDVWKDRAKSQDYGIRVIPTQIFFDAQGKELFRHEGFYSRDEILGRWAELGFTFEAVARSEER